MDKDYLTWLKSKCLSINFPVYRELLDQYKDDSDLIASYESYGLNGMEIIIADDMNTCEPRLGKAVINGQHLFYHLFWLDWWNGNYNLLDELFDTREQWLEYYGGDSREALLDIYRRELTYAEQTGAKYVVYHVAEVTLQDSYTRDFSHSNKEIVEFSLELINELLAEREYPFDFLLENLWCPGMDLTDLELALEMVERINTDRKGIMFDTGHYMLMTDIYTEQEGIDWLMKFADKANEIGLTKWIHGLHLHYNSNGELRRKWANGEFEVPDMSFYELYKDSYRLIGKLDEHKPFSDKRIIEFIKRIDPKYITFEFGQGKRSEYENKLEIQSRTLGLIDEN